MKEKTSILKEAIISKLNESPASDAAKKMGLNYLGYGRYEGDGVIYKSNGDELIPLDGSGKKKPKPKGPSYYETFAKKVNQLSEEDPAQESILEYMLRFLPRAETGAKYGNKKWLQDILNKCMKMFNDTVKECLNNERFRSILLRKYLQRFQENKENDGLMN